LNGDNGNHFRKHATEKGTKHRKGTARKRKKSHDTREENSHMSSPKTGADGSPKKTGEEQKSMQENNQIGEMIKEGGKTKSSWKYDKVQERKPW